MSNQLYLAESVVRSQVKHFGWPGFLIVCCKYSWQYLIGFTVWIIAAVAGHLMLVVCLWGAGWLPNQQQPNPAAKPWVGLLLFPFAFLMGFIAKFSDSKTWEFRGDGIAIHSVTNSSSIKIERIHAITVEDFESYEVWRIDLRDDAETETAVFLKTKHNEKMKAWLFDSVEMERYVDLIEVVG